MAGLICVLELDIVGPGADVFPRTLTYDRPELAEAAYLKIQKAMNEHREWNFNKERPITVEVELEAGKATYLVNSILTVTLTRYETPRELHLGIVGGRIQRQRQEEGM